MTDLIITERNIDGIIYNIKKYSNGTVEKTIKGESQIEFEEPMSEKEELLIEMAVSIEFLASSVEFSSTTEEVN